MIALTNAGAAQAKPTDNAFRRYPARPVDHASPTVIHGQDRLTRDDGDELLWAIKRNRMDAAGHFILAELGCGTDCIRLAAVDALTGRVHWMRKTISSWPIKMLQPVRFRNDSRLVVVFGQPDERGPAGPFRFLLAADGFRPVPDGRSGTRQARPSAAFGEQGTTARAAPEPPGRDRGPAAPGPARPPRRIALNPRPPPPPGPNAVVAGPD